MADYVYGPYFMSYEKGSYFRAHRDVANHKNDPPRLAAHRWSLLLYLNGREPVADLPVFEGGALIIYETEAKLRDRRVVIVPRPGMLVFFRSTLMHEVAIVLEGKRYAVAGWMSSSKSNPFGGLRSTHYASINEFIRLWVATELSAETKSAPLRSAATMVIRTSILKFLSPCCRGLISFWHSPQRRDRGRQRALGRKR